MDMAAVAGMVEGTVVEVTLVEATLVEITAVKVIIMEAIVDIMAVLEAVKVRPSLIFRT